MKEIRTFRRVAKTSTNVMKIERHQNIIVVQATKFVRTSMDLFTVTARRGITRKKQDYAKKSNHKMNLSSFCSGIDSPACGNVLHILGISEKETHHTQREIL
ncbi:hypothetical protein L6164_023496 [Bauhinia variegata]|uniref:Uncharacterized protein n=1 Tax=Bauhinia variegata TaxID=167791 RepID=A0ACB9MID5_BAUVA|nr:hypothetical protein L6164_023496 [Bauhinia variegata]